MAIPTVINFDTTRIPVEGSSTFRADASYVWNTIPTVIDSMNVAIEEQNNVSAAITQSEQNAKTSEQNAKTSEQNAKTSETNAALSAAQVESVVAALPEGAIVDGIVASDKAWSSQKINDELENKQDILVSGTNIKTVGGNSLLGSGDISVSAGLKSIQVFTVSGTWTKPDGVSKVRVIVVGGGGGGGGVFASGTNDSSAGGGGGGTAIKIIDVSSISSVTVTVGALGADTQDGGDSSFGNYCIGGGGGGAPAGTTYIDIGGSGGVASGGDININGTDGSPSAYNGAIGQVSTCVGGNSMYSIPGYPASDDDGNGGTSVNSKGFGAGSSGCLYGDYAPAQGTNGIVIVEEYE